MKNELR